jgi:hypothetical protein
MLFYKYVCDYVLENITRTQLINAAIDCLTNGMESENLCILAGLSEYYNYDDIELYYKLTLDELKIKQPNRKEAAEYLTLVYCKELIDKILSPNIFLKKIKDNIYDKTCNYYKNEKNMGDYIGIENFIYIFYSVNEINDVSNEYYSKLNKNEILMEEYENCFREAEKYLKKNIE